MTVICTVRIPLPLERLREVEDANPDLLRQIQEIAARHMTGHRRVAQGDQVLDLDEFESEEHYRAFIAEAGEAIHRYGVLIGARPEDTLWKVVDG